MLVSFFPRFILVVKSFSQLVEGLGMLDFSFDN